MKTSSNSSLPEALDPSWRIGIVHAPYYREETSAIVESARATLLAAGLHSDHIALFEAPGSFEIPLIGAALAEANAVDALIGIGIIVDGKTHHALHLAQSVVRGMMDVQIRWQIPFAYEVLHVESLDQARERAKKGKEAALAVLKSLRQITAIKA